MKKGPFVVKNLKSSETILNLVKDGKMRPVSLVGRGFFEVEEGDCIQNLDVLKSDRSVKLLKLPSITCLIKEFDI